MGTYTQILYQIVYSTKGRVPCMNKENRRRLYGQMHGILKNKKCHLYRLNGVEDHLHIITHIHPSISLATLIKDLKISSSKFIKKQNLFHGFPGWQVGYGAFTYSMDAKGELIEYVKTQEEHHKTISFQDEYRDLLEKHGIEYDEKYLF